MGMTPKALNRRARNSYLKVAEFQARGAVHFHAVLRLDAAPPRSDPKLVAPPQPGFTAGLLEAALRDVVEHAYVPVPELPGRPGVSGCVGGRSWTCTRSVGMGS